jgi:glutamate--cysteine ligase
MPSPTRQLELADACSLIARCGFGTARTARTAGTARTARRAGARPDSYRTIGVELESFTVPSVHPEQLPDVDLPAGSRLTFEPGGQVELSSPPRQTVAAACDILSTDLAALHATFSPLGVGLVQSGLSPNMPPRLVDTPRYRAMEAYFDTQWAGSGRGMMCATASVQVNLGLGSGARAARRWRAANLLGPVLAAAFSSSPTEDGCGSRRLATWLRLDPSRTAPVRRGPTSGGAHRGADRDPRREWIDYALDANVMLIRIGEDDHQAITDEPLSARAWIERGHEWGWPTADDVAYHLTTLFPPVRPRGWLELRMIDALPDPWWRVPVAVAAVLVDDSDAVRACEPIAGRWSEAAAEGLNDAPLEAAALICAERSLAGLHRVGVDSGTADMVQQWARTVRKGCEPPWR